MSGFPFEKLAPLPWRELGPTGVACSDEVGSKVFATDAHHSFPKRGKAVSIALAKAIRHRVNVHDDLVAMLRECRATFAFAAADGDVEAHAFIEDIDAVLAKAEGRS